MGTRDKNASIYEQLESISDPQSLLNSAVDNLTDSRTCFKLILKSILDIDLSIGQSESMLIEAFVKCLMSFVLPDNKIDKRMKTMKRRKTFEKDGFKLKESFHNLFYLLSNSNSNPLSLQSTDRSDSNESLLLRSRYAQFISQESFINHSSYHVNKELVHAITTDVRSVRDISQDENMSISNENGLTGLRTLTIFSFNVIRDDEEICR
jgi:hypothetical protein